MTSVPHSRRIPGRTAAGPELPRSSRQRMGRTGGITEHGSLHARLRDIQAAAGFAPLDRAGRGAWRVCG